MWREKRQSAYSQEAFLGIGKIPRKVSDGPEFCKKLKQDGKDRLESYFKWGNQ